jgi:transcriptional regulator with XRE-family HTH domain
LANDYNGVRVMKLKDRLREARRQRGVTLLQVADATKLSVSYLSDLERGRTNPSLETLERLAAFYKVSMMDLLAGVDGWGMQSRDSLAPGLLSLVEKGVINEEIAQDLNRIELRGERPRMEEEWQELYLYLKLLMKPYLSKQDESVEEG